MQYRESVTRGVCLGWLMTCSPEYTQFPNDCVFFFVNDISFTPLCSVVLTDPLWVCSDIKGWRRNH